MWDLSPLNKWEFRGADALEAAQRVHTNDVLGMRDGQVRYGAFVDEDGLVVDDGTVFRHSAEHLWVCTNGNERAEYFADADEGPRGRDPTTSRRSCRACRSRARRAATSSARSSRAPTSTRCAYFTFFPDPVTGRRRAGVALAHRVLGGARLRALPASRARSDGLGSGRGRGRHALRRRHHRARARRDRHDRHRLRLRAASTHARTTSASTGSSRSTPTGRSWARSSCAPIAADPPNRFVTIRLEGDDTARVRGGGDASMATRRCAHEPGGEPAARARSGSRSCATESAAPGTEVEVAMPDGTTIGGTVDVLAVYDPKKERPRA